MNSKHKGDKSEARALWEFQKYGIPVALPWGDNQRYDMIVEFDNKLHKVQVKTANQKENNAIIGVCRSSTNHTTNKKYYTYEKNDVDYFVFVNEEHDLVMLVPRHTIGNKGQIALRLVSPLNGNKDYCYAYDFTFDKFFTPVA